VITIDRLFWVAENPAAKQRIKTLPVINPSVIMLSDSVFTIVNF